MLVLARHVNEEVLIGNDIRITVVEIAGNRVRLGIDAPRDIPVHRREVYEAMQAHSDFQDTDANRFLARPENHQNPKGGGR